MAATADYAAQQGLKLAPLSRQDIVSALLNDYGNSFEDDDDSPQMSPMLSSKELPPPPAQTARERGNTKEGSFPAAEKMNMPFQLRVDEPVSPESPNNSSSPEGSPTRIVSKRLNRRSVPRSLTLTKSNGSTAEIPSASFAPLHADAQVVSRKSVGEGKSLPPPPPERSARRQQPSEMGNLISKVRSPRKDSLHSQDGKDNSQEPVKGKQLPKFTSLAELGKGPRGGKGGPLPQPRSSKPSFDDQSDEDRGRSAVQRDNESRVREAATPRLRGEAAPMEAHHNVNNALLPTPNDELDAVSPQPTKKPFPGMGLPSNPKHKKGKSSTGFDVLKSATSPQSQQQVPAPMIITPGPTPSPNKTSEMRQQNNVEIVDPPREYPTSNTPRRPFSFEPQVPTSPPKESLISAIGDQNATAGTNQPSISVASAVAADLPVPQSNDLTPKSSSRVAPPPAFASLPSQQQRSGDPEAMESTPESPPTPPFVPLTDTPVPRSAAPITDRHHLCYSKHATFVWSRNDFQPMACMICNKNDQERKWACVWCYLRICVECSTELQKTPGRDLQAVLQKRTTQATYGGAGYEEDSSSSEGMHPGFEGGVPVSVNGKKHDGGNPALVVWDADAEDAGERVDLS